MRKPEVFKIIKVKINSSKDCQNSTFYLDLCRFVYYLNQIL